ncbi:cell division protein FtsQ/DivIB [Bacillus sp. REN16]|uniref:cell division protein FtsQ/DivIB n=1 Tax=Bacillus sp. REN16 TaxID=2887296 RepID=UPI001E2F950B|nr:FtsQ-type POTRA domain-containing protein [Bacillus sp. REN16]MCC3357561.1 FtsQ-type POTRA domain-containing protein [Bacillus sp. REN16]
MAKQKVVTIEDRIPKLKQRRKQKANRRLIMYITFFFFLLSGILYFQSPFSKIGDITITGNQNISSEQIISLSKLEVGTSFWKVDKDIVMQNIKKHPEIKEVKIEKILPNHIQLNVSELIRVGYISGQNSYYPILENGKIIDKPQEFGSKSIPVDAPILVDWEDEALTLLAKELKKVQPSISKLISEIHHTPTEYDPLQMTLFMTDGYEVKATVRNFAKNITAYPTIISELDPALNGYIELDVVPTFIPYEYENEDIDEEMVTGEGEG